MFDPVKSILNSIANDQNVSPEFAKAVQPKILTTYIHPPIPTRIFDWVAWRDGNEEDGPHGHGRTKADAIRHLLDNED